MGRGKGIEVMHSYKIHQSSQKITSEEKMTAFLSAVYTDGFEICALTVLQVVQLLYVTSSMGQTSSFLKRGTWA